MQSYKETLYDEYLKSVQNISAQENRKLEIERKLILFFIIFLKTIIYLAVTIIPAYFIYIKEYSLALFVFCWLFVVIKNNVSSLFDKLAKIYKRKIKNKCFSRILKCFDFIKDNSNDLFTSLILKKHIMYCTNKHGCRLSPQIDDRFSGTYNNVNYRIAEIGNIHIRGYKGIYSTWNGVFIEFQFNKEIKAPLYVFPKSEHSYIITTFLALLIVSISIKTFLVPLLIFSLIWTIGLLLDLRLYKFKKVDLEDTKFAKLYNVETTDQVEARYILTTAFMDRINNLRRIFNSKDIRIFFENNKMTIAIRTTKDLFEIGDINCSIHDFKQVNQFYEEITTIISFIEYFKLTNRTGL